jgi:hypothetical protein
MILHSERCLFWIIEVNVDLYTLTFPGYRSTNNNVISQYTENFKSVLCKFIPIPLTIDHGDVRDFNTIKFSCCIVEYYLALYWDFYLNFG